MFKKRRGIHVPYNKQGLIYFTCMNIKDMPEDIQERIMSLCRQITEEHYCALYELLTNDSLNIHAIAMKHFVSETQLYLFRKKFYEEFYSLA